MSCSISHDSWNAGMTIIDNYDDALPVLNYAALYDLQAIMKAKTKIAIESYISVSQAYIDDIAMAINNHDMQAVGSMAHSLKSSSKQIGADVVASISQDIEILARAAVNTNIKQLEKLYQQLQEQFTATKCALYNYIKEKSL